MCTQLNQSHQAQLGKGGLEASRRSLWQFSKNRRRVQHTELRAVHPCQAISPIETLRMRALIRQRLQRHRHQLVKQLHGKILSPLTMRRVAHAYTVQLLAVLRYCAVVLQLMIDESADHLVNAHQRHATRPRRILFAQLPQVIRRNHPIKHIQKLHALYQRDFPAVINNGRMIPYLIDVDIIYALTALCLTLSAPYQNDRQGSPGYGAIEPHGCLLIVHELLRDADQTLRVPP